MLKVQARNAREAVHQGTSTVRSVFLGLPAAAQRCVREGSWAVDACPYTALTVCVYMLLTGYMCLHLSAFW